VCHQELSPLSHADAAAVIFMAPNLTLACRWLMSALSQFVTGIDMFMRQPQAAITKHGHDTIMSLQFVIAVTNPADIQRLLLAP
jgi:hypothetical protein